MAKQTDIKNIKNIKSTTNALVSVMKDPREQAILESCISAFEVADGKAVPMKDLAFFCTLRGLHPTEDEIWDILWSKSNLRVRYVPKDRALRWEGKVFDSKGWHWVI